MSKKGLRKKGTLRSKIYDAIKRLGGKASISQLAKEVGVEIPASLASRTIQTANKYEMKRSGRHRADPNDPNHLVYKGRHHKITTTLSGMVKIGDLVRIRKGIYAISDNSPEETQSLSSLIKDLIKEKGEASARDLEKDIGHLISDERAQKACERISKRYLKKKRRKINPPLEGGRVQVIKDLMTAMCQRGVLKISFSGKGRQMSRYTLV